MFVNAWLSVAGLCAVRVHFFHFYREWMMVFLARRARQSETYLVYLNAVLMTSDLY